MRAYLLRSVALAGLLAAAAEMRAAELMTFTLKPVLLLEHHLYEGRVLGPESVFFDEAREEIWVADTKRSLIAVFGTDGMPLYSFGSRKYLRDPKQVAVDPQGRVLVLAGDRSRLRIFNYRGVYLGDLTLPNMPEKPQIAAFFISSKGLLFVGEQSGGEVLIYDYATLKLRRRFGSIGTEEGQFRSICGIAANDDYIVVADHLGTAIQLFSSRGDFIRGWGEHSLGGANFSLPKGVMLDAKGRIGIVDAMRHDIKYFDLNGQFIGHFGGAGREPGSVLAPSAIASDSRGRVYIAERGNSRVQVFEEQQLEKPIPVP